MHMEKVGDYIAEFRRLKEEYAGTINLYMSMEIDYLGSLWGATSPFFSEVSLDYRLSSIHFIPTPDGKELIDVDGSPAGFIEKMDKYFDDDIPPRGRYILFPYPRHD